MIQEWDGAWATITIVHTLNFNTNPGATIAVDDLSTWYTTCCYYEPLKHIKRTTFHLKTKRRKPLTPGRIQFVLIHKGAPYFKNICCHYRICSIHNEEGGTTYAEEDIICHHTAKEPYHNQQKLTIFTIFKNYARNIFEDYHHNMSPTKCA